MNKPNSAAGPSQTATGFSDGQKLAGCYGLKHRIAGAGQAEVWLAHDEVLGKDVSLHFVPRPVAGDAEAMNALRQAVKRNRQLIHPNILRVYDLVEEGDWAAISMDAFDGESLAVLLGKKSGGHFDPAEIQPWIAQLCPTLDDAHKINLVHRDIAPENIFVTGDGRVLVTSFGISRCIEDALARLDGKESPRLAYASPQTLDGAAPARTDDVYSLGALIFHLLTGSLPFEGADLSAQIRNAAPKPVAAIPASWEKTIAACLEKKAGARPQTALEVAKRLAAVSEETTAPAAPAAAEKIAVVVEKPAGEPPVKVLPEVKKTAVIAAGKSAGEPSVAKPVVSEPLVKPAEKNSAAEVFPNLYEERSRFPAMGFALAAALIAVGLVGYYLNGVGKRSQNNPASAEIAPAEPPEGLELRSVNNKIETPAATPAPATPAPQPAPVEVVKPLVAAPPVATPVPVKPATLVAQAAPAKPASTPAPAVAVPAAPAGDEDQAVAEKIAILEKAKQAAQAAEKTRQEMLKAQQQAEAGVAEAQKLIDSKSKAMGPVKKAADDLLAQRKKLEDEQKAADLAAEQARQLAADKAKIADEAKKAIADLESKNKDKLAAREKADSELQSLQKAFAGKQQAVTDASKAAADAEATRQQQLAAIKQSEQEVEQAKAAAAEAKRMREAAAAERRKLDQELADMQDMVKKKMAEIEARRKELENVAAKAVAPAPMPKAPEPKLVEKPSVPAPVPPPSASITPPPATPVPVAATPAPATPVAVIPKPAPVISATPPPQLVMKTEPATPAPVKPPAASGSENSLGMKFVPVGDVEFCIWQTRVKDFDAFARAVNLKSTAWKGPGFKQGPDHPVVNVTWVEAIAFCKWLTDLEHKDGSLSAAQYYRLPTDLEWSKAVGLPEESGKTPEARDMGVPDVYPWGTQWPPPPGAGNYTGEETGSDVAIKGYDDGFAWTSPVGSFPPNKSGIYDMGGNVWQWCMDAWNADSKAKVLRGASWYNGALKLSLLSSCRVHAAPESSTDNYGFRIVRTSDAAKSARK